MYDVTDLPERVEHGHYVIVAGDDGMVRGITAATPAPLAAVLRIEADLTELVLRVAELAGGAS